MPPTRPSSANGFVQYCIEWRAAGTPPNVDLERLIGLSVSSIRAALGAPDRKEPGMPLCEANRCWSYTYGPGPAPLSNEVQHDGKTDFIIVTTGGPFLLILGFSGDRVISAPWLGQC